MKPIQAKRSGFFNMVENGCDAIQAATLLSQHHLIALAGSLQDGSFGKP